MIQRSTVTACCAVFLLLVGLPARGQEGERAEPVLTVRGSGTVRATPDLATVTLGVMAQRPEAADAQREVNAVAGRILEGIKKVGIGGDRIQTSQLDLAPVYSPPRPDQEGPQEPRIVAYRASNVVSVRVDKLDKIGPVIDAGLAAGANRVDGVSFALDDELPARREALRRAVAEAREKAATITSALGVELAEVLEVIEEGVQVQLPPSFIGGRVVAMEVAQVPTPVSPGEVVVSASVVIRYRIR